MVSDKAGWFIGSQWWSVNTYIHDLVYIQSHNTTDYFVYKSSVTSLNKFLVQHAFVHVQVYDTPACLRYVVVRCLVSHFPFDCRFPTCWLNGSFSSLHCSFLHGWWVAAVWFVSICTDLCKWSIYKCQRAELSYGLEFVALYWYGGNGGLNFYDIANPETYRIHRFKPVGIIITIVRPLWINMYRSCWPFPDEGTRR